jgi:DNA-binding transcriptional LysR family regulator
MTDFIALQSFIAVAETGSFTRAADRIGRTQSAVSQQMAKLEGLLGKPLLVRGKSITVTPEGEILLGYARKIYALHREMIDRFRQPELEGEVRFGLPENFASVFLSEVLADFARIHPRILLKIECDLTLNLFERFQQKEFDLVLVKMNQPEDFPNGLDVWSEPLRWVGNSDLVEPDMPVPLVLAPRPCVYRSSAINALDNAGRSWRLVLSSPSYAGAVAAVKAGMGVTVMPQTMIPQELQAIGARILPDLEDTHVSLLKHRDDVAAINTLEGFVLRRLKR